MSTEALPGARDSRTGEGGSDRQAPEVFVFTDVSGHRISLQEALDQGIVPGVDRRDDATPRVAMDNPAEYRDPIKSKEDGDVGPIVRLPGVDRSIEKKPWYRRPVAAVGAAAVGVAVTVAVFVARGSSSQDEAGVPQGQAYVLPTAVSEKTMSGEITVPGSEKVLLNSAAQERLKLLTPSAFVDKSIDQLTELVRISPDLYDGTLEGYGNVVGPMLASILNGVMSAEFRSAYYAKGGPHSLDQSTQNPYYVDAMIKTLLPLFETVFDVNKQGGGTVEPIIRELKKLMFRSYLLGYDFSPEGKAYNLTFTASNADSVSGHSTAFGIKVKDSSNMYTPYSKTVGTTFKKISGTTQNPLDPNLFEADLHVSLSGVSGLGTKGVRASTIMITP
ncbi:hypothetical protein KA093_00675 [Candidatus Saccharibacteria bacterium]|nr:hypothetical protein [Candidatus Saccharibacteria bacterium]